MLTVKQALALKSQAYLLMDENQVDLCKLKAKPQCGSWCGTSNQQVISIQFLKKKKSIHLIQIKLLPFVLGICCSASICFTQC